MSPHPPPRDDSLFPLWERVLKIGWIAAAIVALGVGFVFLRAKTARPPSRYFQPAVPLTADGGVALDPAVSASGKLVAYSCDPSGDGPLAICVRPLTGGETRRITQSAFDATDPDISQDDSTVVFRSEQDGGGIYTAPVDGGDPTLIAAGGFRPRYSPDGNSVAYSDSRHRLFLVPVAGGEPRPIEPGFSSARAPVWSADGQRLLFEGTSGGVTDWWVTQVARPAAIRTHALERLGGALKSWSAPDRWQQGRVLFIAADKDVSHVWALPVSETTSEAAGAPQPVTDGLEQEGSVGAGPYGRLVFSRVRRSVDVWSLPLDPETGLAAGAPVPVTEAASAALPSVSSDGRKLIYVSGKSGFRELWVNQTRVGPVAGRPALSRDGAQIVFGDERCRMALADANAAAESKKLPGCFTVWDWPQPAAIVATFDPASMHTVDILNPQSGARRQILSGSNEVIEDARLSPDGGWIAFTAGGRLNISAARSGAPWNEIAPASSGSPFWSPDGRFLYFRSSRDGFQCIWTQKLDEQKRPAGPPAAVRHLHGAALGLRLLDPGTFQMSIGAGRLFFNMAKTASELWITTQ